MDESRYKPFRWAQLRPNELQSQDLRTALETWQASCGSRFAPVWDVSVINDLPAKLIPFCNVIDTGNGRPPFSYRFFGTGLASMHTFELTNKSTDAIEPEGFRNLCVDQHVLTIGQKAPMAFMNEIPTKIDGRFLPQFVLRLPYSNDGAAVSNIMTVEVEGGPPEQVWERFRED